MDVRIVEFPETKVAAAEHRGPPHLEHRTAKRLIEWRIENRVPPDRHATYGVHYTNPLTTPPEEHRMDVCVAFAGDVPPNPHGVIPKLIAGGRCAVARHIGSREHNPAAAYLHEVWLPASGEALRDSPIFFHYVNVGPNVQEHEIITDVYLPIS